MDIDLAAHLAEIEGHGLLPVGLRTAFVAGSLARGWANPLSDLDIYVVCDRPWSRAESGVITVPLRNPVVATESFTCVDRRCELKYWSADQARQILEKVSWAEFEAGRSIGQMVTRDEEQFLERALFGYPISGDDWLATLRESIRKSAFQSSVVAFCLANADDFCEDALGQMEAGDVDSAVLSVRQAFGHAVDALVASHGEVGRLVKWRARRMAAARPEALSYDEFWSIETMRSFNPADPRPWIREVIDLCKRLALETEV